MRGIRLRASALLLAVLVVAATDTQSISLVGTESLSLAAVHAHVASKNPGVDPFYLKRLYEHYVSACGLEGVSLPVAIAQMIHETDYLRFTGAVAPIQYNYAGIGATGEGMPGERFPDMRTGVVAHVQHIKAYASREPTALPLVDPRFHLVVRGSAASVADLTGRWATDPLYGEKLAAHIEALRRFHEELAGD